MAVLSRKQSGSKTLAGGATTETIARGVATGFDSTVTPATTILLVTMSAGGAWRHWELTDGDTITITSNADNLAGDVVYWTLLEYSSGVAVQHTSITIADSSASNTVAIDPAVTLAQSFIIPGGGIAADDAALIRQAAIKLDSTVQASATRGSAGAGTNVLPFQVVDYTGCSVQDVNHTLSASELTTTTKDITAVTLANTAIFASMYTDRNEDNNDEQFWDCYFSDTDTITWIRNAQTAAADFNFRVYVVEFTDGTVVRRGALQMADGVTQDTDTITEVTVAQSAVIASGSDVYGQAMGRNAHTAPGFNRLWGAMQLAAATTVQVDREDNGAITDMQYQVIQFNATAAAAANAQLSVETYDFDAFEGVH